MFNKKFAVLKAVVVCALLAATAVMSYSRASYSENVFEPFNSCRTYQIWSGAYPVWMFIENRSTHVDLGNSNSSSVGGLVKLTRERGCAYTEVTYQSGDFTITKYCPSITMFHSGFGSTGKKTVECKR